MLYVFLLLGLLPMALLPDGSETSEETDTEDDIATSPINDSDDLLDDMTSGPPDDADPETEDPEDVLLPIDEDDIADSEGENPDPEDILPPLIEDDDPTPPDGEEGEILDPVDEDDTPDKEINVAIAPEPDVEVIEIADFDSEKDILCIEINRLHEIGENDVEVQLSQNGEDSEVYIKGELAAVLTNVSNATASNIYLTQMLDAA